MPTLAIQLIAVALLVVHLRGSVKVSAAALIGSTFVIPGAILFPQAPAYVFVARLGLWAACVGLLVRAGRGDIDRSLLRPSRVLVAFGLFVAAAFVIGVANGPYPSQSARSFELWLLLLDQFLFLWAATVFVRLLGVRFIAACALVGVVFASGIAIAERVTGASYAHWWFRHQVKFGLAGQRLETRGGKVRVRATGEYSLQFAWVLAYFMPLLGVLALRTKRFLVLLAPVVVMIAIVLTVTRSVFGGLGLGALCLLLFARGDRKVIGAVFGVALLAAAVYASSGAVRHPYQAADPESQTVRTRRLSILTNELTHYQWTGLGLDGPTERGIDSTDSALLGTYAGTGALGVAALIGALATAALTIVAAGVLGDPEDGPIAGALLGALVAAGLGMFAFDSLSGPLPSWNLWLFAALGVGLYEEVMAKRAGPLRPRSVRLSPRRLILPLFGLGLGAAVMAATPTHVASEFTMFTLSPTYLTQADTPHVDFVGRVLVQATCDSVRAAFAVRSDVHLDCFDPLQSGPGTGLVRIETRTRAELRDAATTFYGVAKRVHGATRIAIVRPAVAAKPTWARTAPGTGALLFAELALLLPSIRFRRRRVTSRSRVPASPSLAYR
ncbi:MAG TPA: hypothetical protein VHC63_12285 [Acidimicrobiales bacterium]|nr:hypothetical protein [Acidimicrobiales bacterium]